MEYENMQPASTYRPQETPNFGYREVQPGRGQQGDSRLGGGAADRLTESTNKNFAGGYGYRAPSLQGDAGVGGAQGPETTGNYEGTSYVDRTNPIYRGATKLLGPIGYGVDKLAKRNNAAFIEGGGDPDRNLSGQTIAQNAARDQQRHGSAGAAAPPSSNFETTGGGGASAGGAPQVGGNEGATRPGEAGDGTRGGSYEGANYGGSSGGGKSGSEGGLGKGESPTPGDTAGTPFAHGGMVQGPGGPMSDQVPISASNGEYVLQAEAAQTLGPQILHMLNNPQFAAQFAQLIQQAMNGPVDGGMPGGGMPGAGAPPMPGGDMPPPEMPMRPPQGAVPIPGGGGAAMPPPQMRAGAGPAPTGAPMPAERRLAQIA